MYIYLPENYTAKKMATTVTGNMNESHKHNVKEKKDKRIHTLWFHSYNFLKISRVTL